MQHCKILCSGSNHLETAPSGLLYHRYSYRAPILCYFLHNKHPHQWGISPIPGSNGWNKYSWNGACDNAWHPDCSKSSNTNFSSQWEVLASALLQVSPSWLWVPLQYLSSCHILPSVESPRASCKFWVEVCVPVTLHSACLQNQHHMHDASSAFR